jgi:molybdopterin guanine dinucleotide-containing S/N-oxide reductase-like protein
MEDKEEKEQGQETNKVSRRDFIKSAGLVLAGVAAGGVAGAGITSSLKPEAGTVEEGTPQTVEVIKEVPVATEGVLPSYLEPEESMVVQIQHLIQYDTKNGKIIRGRRVHFDKDYPELEPWTLTARGKTWTVPMKSPAPAYYLCHRKRQDSPNRVLYPLKRVDWEPGGDADKINAQNRGVSNYVRISWEEAASIIAGEMKRVCDTYGTEALGPLYGGGHSEGHNVPGSHGIQEAFMNWWTMSEYGTPPTYQENPATSSSGGQLGGRYVQGNDYETRDVLKDVAENADMILIWSGDPEAKAWRYPLGMTMGMWWRWFGELGIKRISITPNLNLGASIYADKWIPVLPKTDSALMLAIAYIWLQEGTFDQQYLDTHTTGFDKFKAYVLGQDDDTPKTPEWASPLCGVPTWTIKALARAWASQKTTIGYGRSGGGATNRSIYADNPNRIQIYLLAMQGFGGPGKHQMYYLQSAIGGAAQAPSTGSVNPASKWSTAMEAEGLELPSKKDRQAFPRGLFGPAVLDPPVEYYSTGDQFRKITYPLPGKSEVHMIWGTSASYTGSMQWGFGVQKAMQSPKFECIVHQCMYMEDALVFSDIILPITTAEEQPDINTTVDTYNSITLRTEPLVPAKGEEKTDVGAVLEVAKALGWFDKLTGGKTYEDFIQDLLKEGYDNSGVTDLVSWEKLQQVGYFPQTPDPHWYDREPEYKAFYDDPENNPLPTPSGKLEFVSQLLLENFPNDKERPPMARYITGGPASEGWSHDEDLTSERAKTYPLVIVSDTSTWKHHSMFSDVPWTREIEKVIGWDNYAYSPVWISPQDAEARGIKDGDIVRVFNEKGSVLGGAVIDKRIIPGALRFEKAGGGHHIIPGEVHHGGNPNCINPKENFSHNVYGLACTHYLVEIEKVSGSQMEEWRDSHPEHFTRLANDYDPAYGPFFSGWVEKEA